MPFFSVVLELSTELGVGATNSEASREAVPIFLESGAISGGACSGAAGAGNVGNCGRGAVALRGVVRGKTRQVYFRAELGFLEGTPLCPCLIQVLRACTYGTVGTLGTCTRHNFGHTSAHLYLWRAVESTGLLPVP